MPVSKLQANWTGVTFTPTIPSSAELTFDGVTSFKIGLGGNVMLFKADGDLYDIMSASLTRQPTYSMTLADYYQVLSMGAGVVGTQTATHNDARLQTGGGIVFTITSGVFESCDVSGDHAAWGSGVANFKTVTPDGATNPIGLGRI